MYLCLTTRCDMLCPHCCNSATAKGEDMSEEIFKKAVDICAENGSGVMLGGGEPTIHPKFWQFLGYAIGKVSDNDAGIWMATNGKVTSTALALAKMAKSGVIGVALSLDCWHEKIDPKVVEAFEHDRRRADGFDRSDDRREIRDVGHGYQGSIKNPIIAGRWKGPGGRTCPCEEIYVKPDGTVKQCGCRRSPVIGHVLTGYEPMSNDDGENCCYRKLKKKAKVA